MRRFIVLWFVLSLTAGGCGRPSTDKDPQAKQDSQRKRASTAAQQAELGDFLIGQPVRYQNLAIFPVCSKVPKDEDRYITLEEGLKAGTVEIFEVGADAAQVNAAEVDLRPTQTEEAPPQEDSQEPPVQPDTDGQFAEDPFAEPALSPQEDTQQPLAEDEVAGDVNRLVVLNRSGKPLYLMPGEVIYGGKQDRTIAEEAIILASDEPVPIDVYCVEQGRWASRAGGAAVADLAVLTDGEDVDEETLEKLAADAKRGKFVASAGNLSKETRLIVQANKGQVQLWNGVAEANAAADLEVQSGAFTANYATAEVVDQLKPYIEKLQAPVAEQKQVVGAIVAINGKVEAVDVFGSTPLFRKLWPKLLKSHALDAANLADAEGAEKVCTLGDAKGFLDNAMQGEVEKKTEAQGGLVVTQRSSHGVVSFSAGEDAAAAYGGMGGFGASVHSSAFAE